MQSVPVLYNSLGSLQLQDLLRLLVAFSTAAQHSPAVYSQELYAALTGGFCSHISVPGTGTIVAAAPC